MFSLTRVLQVGLCHRFSKFITQKEMSETGRRELERMKNEPQNILSDCIANLRHTMGRFIKEL